MKEFVSFIVFEGEMTRLERVIKRLWILCIILFIALITTNCLWLAHSQNINGTQCVETNQTP